MWVTNSETEQNFKHVVMIATRIETVQDRYQHLSGDQVLPRSKFGTDPTLDNIPQKNKK